MKKLIAIALLAAVSTSLVGCSSATTAPTAPTMPTTPTKKM